MEYPVYIVIVGAGATAVMDIWSLLRRALLGMAPPDYGLVGRWVAYLPRGRFHHASIKATPPVRGERLLGWTFHYLTGVAFAALLIGTWGPAWIERPSLGPALFIGFATVAAPFLLMQPGMGLGIAGSRTPRPGMTRLQSLMTHTVFGLGLYTSGWLAHYCLQS